MKLVDKLKSFYAGTLNPPKFWIEETLIPYGGKVRPFFSVKSNIIMRVPQ